VYFYDSLPALGRWVFTPEVLGVIPSLGVANVYKPIPRSGATPSLEGARLGMPVTVRKGLGMGDVN